MKLFLASRDISGQGQVLIGLVGNNRKALIISNARDYYQDESIIRQSVGKTITNLTQIGISSERLDLRPYFGHDRELRNLLIDYQPGLIFAIGGNVYCLATALHKSGMAEIICQGVKANKFVYGGYSAGAMVASTDLSLYDVGGKFTAAVSSLTYHIPPSKQGLSLISEYIVPHINQPDSTSENNLRIAQIKQAGKIPILLNDSEVLVIDK